MHTHTKRPNSCLLVTFSLSVVILCYSLSVLDLAFWDYFKDYVIVCLCVCAFVVLYLVPSVLRQEIG